MARPKYPSDMKAQFMLRLPQGLHEKVMTEAEKNGRSMNSEIVSQLERCYQGRSLEEIGAREKAFEDALEMMRSSIRPMKFKLVLDE